MAPIVPPLSFRPTSTPPSVIARNASGRIERARAEPSRPRWRTGFLGRSRARGEREAARPSRRSCRRFGAARTDIDLATQAVPDRGVALVLDIRGALAARLQSDDQRSLSWPIAPSVSLSLVTSATKPTPAPPDVAPCRLRRSARIHLTREGRRRLLTTCACCVPFEGSVCKRRERVPGAFPKSARQVRAAARRAPCTASIACNRPACRVSRPAMAAFCCRAIRLAAPYRHSDRGAPDRTPIPVPSGGQVLLEFPISRA